MSETHSSPASSQNKPAKPYPEFPLLAQAMGTAPAWQCYSVHPVCVPIRV